MSEARIRGLLGRDARRRLVALSRLRWLRKAKIARRYGATNPRIVLPYVLADPEVDTFTYDLANLDELLTFVANTLDVPEARASALINEAQHDPVLNKLDDKVRWRWDFKRKVLFGRRYAWYAIARELKPELIVETGIHHGLGSALLLRALQRNAAEGSPGTLLSFDLYPDKGWLVPDELKAGWEPVFAPTTTALEPALEGRTVGMLIHDSTPEAAPHEYRTALAHGAERVALVAGTAHHSPALRELAAERGVPYHHFQDRPRRHVAPGSSTGAVIFPRP